MDLQNSTSPRPPDAVLLAAAITFNCDQYNRQAITRAMWHAEQMRLWNLAASARIASDVVRLVTCFAESNRCERCGSVKPAGQSCICFDNGCQ